VGYFPPVALYHAVALSDYTAWGATSEPSVSQPVTHTGAWERAPSSLDIPPGVRWWVPIAHR
jgi:hypothetical protein